LRALSEMDSRRENREDEFVRNPIAEMLGTDHDG